MGDESFSKACRITKTGDYQVLYREGRRVSSQHFLLFFRPSTSTVSRVGLSSGKKVGSAVVRNRVKRRMREVVRRYRPNFNFIADIILVAHPKSAELSYEQLETEIKKLLTKARLI